MRPLLRKRLSSPPAVAGMVLIQLIAAVAYAAFWLDSGPTHSDVRANLEFDSFFVAPFVWAALLVAGVWLLRQPLRPREAVAVKTSMAVTGVCAAWAIAIAGLFVLADLVFWLTGF